jgi:EmrB/QacA subfamily drug resistance transporter
MQDESHGPVTQETEKSGVLLAMILAAGTVFLNEAVVNVALPAIARGLDATLADLQWTVDAYTLTLAALLILGGALGDRYGRRRVMLVGLAGYGLFSLAGGLAPSTGWLIAARTLQGMSGALLVPGSLAIIRAVYREPAERGRAIGQWSGWSALPIVIGPLIGGWLVDTLSWRWAFFVILPLNAAALWLMITQVPAIRAREREGRLDLGGAALAFLGLGGIAYALIEGPALGWAHPQIWIAAAVGTLSLVAFPLLEARVDHPMVPLRLFRSSNFVGANLTTLGLYAALYGSNFFLVLYIQNVMGYSALIAGLMLAPPPLLLLVLSPVFGKLAGRHGPRVPMTVGPLVSAVGLLLLARLQPDSSVAFELLPAITIFGLGLSATVAPLTDTVMASVSEQVSGTAAAFNNVVSRIAGLLAVAGLGVVVSLTFAAALAQQTAPLDLQPEVQERLQEIRQNPTGQIDVAALPAEVASATQQAYTSAFRRAMLVAGALAIGGGIAAAATVRKVEEEVRDG